MKTSIECFKVDKLIRDKIPAIQEANRIVVSTRTLENPEFISRLKDKLIEEAKECFEAESKDELCEEIADVLEVINALSEVTGLSMEQIENKRIEKKEAKGGFANKIYCSFVEIEENNPAITYYLKKPHLYPKNTLY